MERYFKLLIIIALLGGAVAAVSYVGARTTVSSFLGPNPPLAGRTTRFAFDGVERLPGRPRVWVFTYRSSTLPGVPAAQFFVSPTGTILAVLPEDLDLRLEQWEKSKVPIEIR